MSVTLAILRATVLGYADMEASAFRSESDLDQRINTAWKELYGLLVKQHQDFFEDEHDITVVSGDGTYSLAAVVPGVRMLRGVSYLLSDEEGDELPLQPFQWSERGQFASSSAPLRATGGRDLRYCLRGENLILRPVPDAGATIRVYYVPRCKTLVVPVVAPAVLGDDEIDALPTVVEPGWEDFVARGAAAALLLEQNDPDAKVHLAVKDAVRDLIEEESEPRDEDAPHEIVRRVSYEDGDF